METNENTAPEAPPAAPAQEPEGTTAPPAKAEPDWKAEARKWEERAKANHQAAQKLAEIEEAGKSEIQKAQERAQAAEQRAAELEQRATLAELNSMKARVAVEMGVIPEAINGTTEEELRASAQRVLDWAKAGTKPAPPIKSLSSGSSGSGSGERGRAAEALRRMRQG